MEQEIYSYQVEKHVLGGACKHSGVFAEIQGLISENDFHHEVHQVLWCVVSRMMLNHEKVDKVVLAQKVKDLGISFKDDINIFSYVDNLFFTQITPAGAKQAAQELSKLRIRRELVETAEKERDYVVSNGDKSVDEIVSGFDAIHNEKINTYSTVDEPVNIFAQMEQLIEERGNNPVEDIGYLTPFKDFNRLYGGLRPGNLYAVVSRAGQGKALDNETLIPVPTGWKKIKNLKVGDEVFAIDGRVTKVVGVRSWKNRQLYKVTTKDGHTVFADEEHEWFVKRRPDYNWETLTSRDLFKFSKDRRFKLPLQGAIELPENKLEIDPYIFGVWLGDGHSGSACITSSDDFVIDKVKQYAETLGMKVTKDNSKYNHRLNSNKKKNPFSSILKLMGVLNNKHIPINYLRSSSQQRLKLLQGLIDSDGHVMADGQVEFCNKNKKLAEGVKELVLSLGAKASIHANKASLYGVDCGIRYRVRFYLKNAALLPRKNAKTQNSKRTPYRYFRIEKVGIGDTTCIQIKHPSHVFLCGDGYIPTHNSSWLNSMTLGTSQLSNFKVKTLVLDTEMFTSDITFRVAAAMSGVPFHYIETGKWRRNAEMTAKIRAAMKSINQNHYYDHYQVGNKNIEQVCSMCRRWYFNRVGRGNPAIIAYDYVKLTGEKVGQNWAEHQVIGQKIDTLKKLGEELNVPVVTAMQMNRAGESFNRKSDEIMDDSSAIALSDRLSWFASFVGIFRRKTVDEVVFDGEQFGTHKLIPLKTRFQGADAGGHIDIVKRKMPDGKDKWFNNYLNYSLENFSITECGTLHDVVTASNHMPDIAENSELHEVEL